MLKIKFKNNKEVLYETALETEEYWGGASRRTLTVQCKPTATSIDKLNEILSDEKNVQRLELANDESSTTNVYDGYCLKLSLGIEKQLDNADQNTYKDVLVFKLGKRNFIEQQLHALGIGV